MAIAASTERPPLNDFYAWLLAWLKAAHSKYESCEDLFVVLHADVHRWLRERAATDEEYERVLSLCLHLLLRDLAPDQQRKLVRACEERLHMIAAVH